MTKDYKAITRDISAYMGELRKLAPEAMQGFSALAKGAGAEGALDRKTKELIALAIGVPPVQFVVLVALTNFAQSVQHANIRIDFGRVLERLIVSPSFHRRHHAIGYGHEGLTYGCNFGVLFPWWDMLFGSASWNRAIEPTGIRDQLEGERYGEGFFEQHWLAFVRIARRLAPKRASSGDGAAV